MAAPALVVPFPEQTIRVEDVSRDYRIPRETALRLIREGEWPHVPVGRAWLVRRAVVEAWLRSQERAGVEKEVQP